MHENHGESAPPADEKVYALVMRFGSNVLEVVAHPRTRSLTVAAALEDAGLPWSPVAVDASGLPQTLLSFSEDDYPPGAVAAYVDALAERGVGAYGYELFHAHEFADLDLWERVGRVPASAAGAPVFLKAYPHDEWSSADVWLFGDAWALDDLTPAVAQSATSCDPVQGPQGTSAVRMTYSGDAVGHRVTRIPEAARRVGVDLRHPW